MAQSTTRRLTRRRSAGEGSVYLAGRRWRGSILRTEPDGSRSRRCVSDATAADTRAKLDAIRRERRLGTLSPYDSAVRQLDGPTCER